MSLKHTELKKNSLVLSMYVSSEDIIRYYFISVCIVYMH